MRNVRTGRFAHGATPMTYIFVEEKKKKTISTFRLVWSYKMYGLDMTSLMLKET